MEKSHCIQRYPHFRVLELRGSTVYRDVLISGGWNRGIPPTIFVQKCQFGIEEFYCSHQGI